MTMAGALSVTLVHPYVHTLHTYVCPKTSALQVEYFYRNFMKLGHIVKYHDVFKFNNGPYRTMPSVVMDLCL